jgi:hypothetical protein
LGNSGWIELNISVGVADYGYDFNFLDACKIYNQRILDIFKIVFANLDSATPMDTFGLGDLLGGINELNSHLHYTTMTKTVAPTPKQIHLDN